MQVNHYISALIQYGLSKKLFEPCDQTFMANRILEILHLDEFHPEETRLLPLEEILKGLLEDAVSRGICDDDITSRDLLDTKLMGAMTPSPREVRKTFSELYAEDPTAATEAVLATFARNKELAELGKKKEEPAPEKEEESVPEDLKQKEPEKVMVEELSNLDTM